MAFNVANRPLLFEQQTQEFINLYNQIKSLQAYVKVLRDTSTHAVLATGLPGDTLEAGQ